MVAHNLACAETNVGTMRPSNAVVGRSAGRAGRAREYDEYAPLLREYSAVAARYDMRWKFYIEASLRVTLRRLVLAPGDRVLDVRCGTGALLKALSLVAPQTTLAGVDLSGEMLEVARNRLGTAADLRQAHAETLPFSDKAFDVAV